MPTRTEKFTRSTAAGIVAEGREHWIHDTDVTGLAIRVSPAGRGVYYLTRKIDGRLVRARIAPVTGISHTEARTEAKKLAATMTLTGRSPNAAKRERRRRDVTLGEAYADYIDGRGVKAGTLENYERYMRLYLDRWVRTPLAEIGRDDVRRHYARTCKTSESSATGAMRLLRAIYTYADGEYKDTEGERIRLDNPVKELSRKKLWKKPRARTARLRQADFAPWFAALDEIEPTPRDYLKLVLFTGLRRREATALEWKRVDLDAAIPTATVLDTKNGDPLTIPLTSAAVELLRARRAYAPRARFVFAAKSKSGHIEEPKGAVARVRALSGIDASPHALRRTFVSIAESIDVGPYTIKRLVNHKSGDDVTEAHYVDIELPRLLAASQRITDTMLGYASETNAANVVPIRAQA